MSPSNNNKPWSESSVQNRAPILAVLSEAFSAPGTALEIGSGTGQHAVYFAADLPHLQWQPSDVAENLPGIRLWRTESALDNILNPIELDVKNAWPETIFDYVFSANTAHIMSWPLVQLMLSGVANSLRANGKFCLYGPFNRNGKFTSESNERFESWLKSRDPESGIRDIEEVVSFAASKGLEPVGEHPMPANNLILAFSKR